MKNKLYYLISSSGGAQFIFFLANCLIMSLYAPSDIGVYGYYVTLASVFSIVAALRLDFFAFFSTNKTAIDQESVLLCANVILFGMTLGLFLSAYAGLWTYKHAFYLSLSLWSFSFFYLVSQSVLRLKEYKLFATARWSQSLLLLLLIGLLQKNGASGLVFAYAVSQILIGVFLVKRLKYRFTSVLSLSEVTNAFRYRIKERLYNTLSTSIQYLSPALPMLLGYHFFSKEELGFYFLLSQFLGGASSILRRSFLGLLNAELMQDGAINPSVIRLIQGLFVTGLTLAFVLLIASLMLEKYDFFNDESWHYTLKLLPPLLFLYTVDAFIQPIGTLLPAIGKETYFFTIESVRLLSVFLSFILICFLDGRLVDFSYLYSAVMVVCYLSAGAMFLKFTYQVSYCEEKI